MVDTCTARERGDERRPERRAPGYVLAEVDNFDVFQDLARGWDLDTWLFRAGGFRASLYQTVDTAWGWNFGHARLDTHARQAGGTPRSLRTFAVPDAPDISLYWRSQSVDGGCILAYPPNGEHAAVTPPNYGAYVVSVHERELRAQLSILGLPDVLTEARGREVVRCPAEVLRLVRSSMDNYEQGVVAGLSVRRLARLRRSVICALLQGLAEGQPGSGRRLPRVRERTVREAEVYVRDNAREAPTVEDLCHLTGASIRTLQYGFRQVLGISPKAYIMAVRLNCVRKALDGGHPSHPKVADAANEWGFWHMGSFAADYRRLFGELPSTTLRRAQAIRSRDTHS